jgi:hypothetical protein
VHVASDARTAVASAEATTFSNPLRHFRESAERAAGFARRNRSFALAPEIRERAARTHTPDANMASGFGACVQLPRLVSHARTRGDDAATNRFHHSRVTDRARD